MKKYICGSCLVAAAAFATVGLSYRDKGRGNITGSAQGGNRIETREPVPLVLKEGA